MIGASDAAGVHQALRAVPRHPFYVIDDVIVALQTLGYDSIPDNGPQLQGIYQFVAHAKSPSIWGAPTESSSSSSSSQPAPLVPVPIAVPEASVVAYDDDMPHEAMVAMYHDMVARNNELSQALVEARKARDRWRVNAFRSKRKSKQLETQLTEARK